MKPEQVTDEMMRAAADSPFGSTTQDALRNAIAAAINAMPDDLLRELVAERGCVMVPREPTEKILDALYPPLEMDDPGLRRLWSELLAAAEAGHA